jgi:DNA-binding CsgD family transcriptional regulator
LAESAQFSVEHGVRTLDTAKLEPLGVPEGVRQVIGRRLSRLSPEANRMLQVAAVLGDGFGFADIAVADMEEARLLDAVEEALRAGILYEEGNAYHFTHALIRQTIHDGMTLPRRQRLHLRVAEAIEDAQVADSGGRAAKQAVHYRLAGALADREKTIAHCLRAGEAAATVFAWEEAVDHWRAALDLMKPTDDRRQCELLAKLGEVQRRAGDLHQAMATFRQAATEARRLADPQLLAHAALGFEDALLPSGLPRAGVGDTSILLLEEAFGALTEAYSSLRARVLAALARALYFAGERDRGTALSEQAVDLARRAGDPAALAYALGVRRIAIWGPDHGEERLAVADELMQLADATGDLELPLAGHEWRLSAVFELGDMPAVITEIEASAQLAEALRQPQGLSDVAAWRATLALMDGQLEEAERLTYEALTIGQRAQSQNAVVHFTVQMVVLRREQWRLDDLRGLESVVRSYAEQYPLVPSWRPLLALLACDLGNHAGAWRIFDEIAVNDFTDIPRNSWLWLHTMTMLSETSVALGDTPRAARLYEILLPYADRNVTANTAITCFGSVSYFLGRLATLLSRWEDAARHFEQALTMNERMGLKPWVAHTLRAYAHLLVSRPNRAARELGRAREMLEQAVAIYAETTVERGKAEAITLLADRRLATIQPRSRAYADRLTEREVEVLRLVADGSTNREIADRLFLSVRTVERHIGNIYAKTGVHDRRSARLYALHHGLIDVAVHGPT